MIRAEDAALILLAAGRSSRFEGGNKLEAPFLNKPVGLHVATALASVPFRARYVVTDGCKLEWHGFEVVHNDDPDSGIVSSLRLGLAAARGCDPEAAVLALADMPRVTASHVYRLLDAADGPTSVVTSSDGRTPKPPAVFGADRFDMLMQLSDLASAREMVRGGKRVITSPAELFDIDTPEDLQRLNDMVGVSVARQRSVAPA